MSKKIKANPVIEEVKEEVEAVEVVETEANKLSTFKAGVKKHGKKIAAVLGTGAIAVGAFLAGAYVKSKNDGEGFNDDTSIDNPDDLVLVDDDISSVEID